jgi:hypothetical protein
MPAAQQNALVQKYCAVCHTDAARNGGLSLEHFDAAQASPSLTAMLLSKLTGGVSLATVREAGSSASAAALVDQKMKSGAMGAGIPIPDKVTIDAMIHAFALKSAGATEWTVERSTATGSGTDGQHRSRGAVGEEPDRSRDLPFDRFLQRVDAGWLRAIGMVAGSAERKPRHFGGWTGCGALSGGGEREGQSIPGRDRDVSIREPAEEREAGTRNVFPQHRIGEQCDGPASAVSPPAARRVI